MDASEQKEVPICCCNSKYQEIGGAEISDVVE